MSTTRIRTFDADMFDDVIQQRTEQQQQHRGDIDCTFLKPVALTTQGIIIRKYEPNQSKYLIQWSSTGSRSNLNEETCDKIDEYLKSNKPFDEELFTL